MRPLPVSSFCAFFFISGCGPGGGDAQVTRQSSGNKSFFATISWDISAHLNVNVPQHCQSGWCTYKFELPEKIEQAMSSFAIAVATTLLAPANGSVNLLGDDVYMERKQAPVKTGDGIDSFVQVKFSKRNMNCYLIQLHFVLHGKVDASAVTWLGSFREVVLRASGLQNVQSFSHGVYQGPSMIWTVSRCPGLEGQNAGYAEIVYSENDDRSFGLSKIRRSSSE